MNISLTPEPERMLDEEQEQLKQQRLSEVRRKIDRAINHLDRGLGIPGPETRARLRQRRTVK